MGIFERFTGFLKRNEFNKDFNVNDKLMKYYGEGNTIDSYLEINKLTKNKFKETLDFSDQILEKYKEKNNDDIQNELMKKYLKLSQDDINKQMILEEEQVGQEVDESLKNQNLSEEEKKKIKEETLEEKRKEKVPSTEKDKKKALQTRIYEATYNVMYKDYAYKVGKIKDAQFDSRELALGTKEAVEIIAMEKNLEKIDLLYHNHTGKEITKVARIKTEKDSFERKMNYNENGIQNIANNNSRRLLTLYKERAEKYKVYIDGLKNPNVKPAEKAMLKRQYEDANLKLIESVPSLQEFSKDLKEQGDIEKMAGKEIGGRSITMSGRSMDENEISVSDSKTADNIHDIINEKTIIDDKSYEHSKIQQEDAIRQGNYQEAKEIGDAQRNEQIYNEGIDDNQRADAANKIKHEQEKEDIDSDRNFARSLRKVNNLEDKSPDELQKIVEDRQEDAQDKIRENAERQKEEQEAYQREIRNNNKPNN